MKKGHEILPEAMDAWRQALGDENLFNAEHATQRYAPNTIAITRRIPAALAPKTVDHVVALIRIASQYHIPLYPISTGNNWGYGSANPVVDGCVIVDLSNMNQILEMDAELGLVTLQPGVTQRQLRDYLDQHNFSYLVPVTGAGPNCSLLGNALERFVLWCPLGSDQAIGCPLVSFGVGPSYLIENSELVCQKFGVLWGCPLGCCPLGSDQAISLKIQN